MLCQVLRDFLFQLTTSAELAGTAPKWKAQIRGTGSSLIGVSPSVAYTAPAVFDVNLHCPQLPWSASFLSVVYCTPLYLSLSLSLSLSLYLSLH